jgi:predicted DCC family thiol-disulfide oxidoreductase YuxK
LSRAAILYDRDCGFCRVSCAAFLALDRRRRLRPVAIQDAEGQRLLAGVPEERRLDSWHLVTGDGEVHSAGAGFGPIFRLLPGGKPVAALAERFPAGAERAYFFVADRRSPLGRHIPQAVKRWADRLVGSRA